MKRIPIFLASFLAVCLACAAPARAGEAAEPTFNKQSDGKLTSTVHGVGATKEAARADAVEAAQEAVARYLRNADHAIRFVPAKEYVLKQMLVKETISDIPTNSSDIGTVYDVALNLEMSPAVQQYFRKAGRVTSGLWGLGCAIGSLLVIGLFFRLDEWTKGYLTTWLLFAAVGVISGLAVLWFLVE